MLTLAEPNSFQNILLILKYMSTETSNYDLKDGPPKETLVKYGQPVELGPLAE